MQHNAGTPFVLLVVQQQVLPASYMRFEATASLAGKSHIAPLVGEMLQRIQAEVARYERVITYWPSFGPSLEAAVCAALRTTTAAVSRQCGLIPMIGVSPSTCHTVVLPVKQIPWCMSCLPAVLHLPNTSPVCCFLQLPCFTGLDTQGVESQPCNVPFVHSFMWGAARRIVCIIYCRLPDCIDTSFTACLVG